MSRRNLVARSLPRLLLAFAAACAAVGPDHTPPTAAAPAAWTAGASGASGAASGMAPDPVEATAWWRNFDDAALAQLVESALAENRDLRAAWLRLESATALRGVAAADRWPSVDARGSYEHRRESPNTPFGAFIPRTNIHTVAFDATWELDLWGRVRRSVEAADADLAASAADAAAAAITVAAEVASAYVDLRAAQRRLQIAAANLQLQEQTLGLVRARLEAGLVVERDVAQAMTNVETTRSRLPSLAAAATAAQNRLAVLLGRMPGDLPADVLAPAPLPKIPARVAVGLPADLLRRRPDVQAAERRFAAAVARIGVAEAERYPRFALGGTLGLAANSAKELFDTDSDVLGFGPSVRWNLFDGGRLRQRVRALEATAEAAQVAWEQTVLLAVEEAETAMTYFAQEQVRRGSLQRAAEQARRAVELAKAQYREGLSDFQAVLDSERIVAQIEDDLASSDAAIGGNLVALYKALAGGMPAAPETVAAR